MRLVWVLVISVSAGLWWWLRDPSPEPHVVRVDFEGQPGSEACRRADEVGDGAAAAANAAGVDKGWMTDWVRGVTRRGWGRARNESCPDKN